MGITVLRVIQDRKEELKIQKEIVFVKKDTMKICQNKFAKNVKILIVKPVWKQENVLIAKMMN